MRPCEFENLIEALHDGELNAERSREAELHLAACPRCQASLRALESISQIMVNTPALRAGALARIHAEVDRTIDRSLLPLARTLIGVAAAVLIVSGVGLWQVRPAHPSAPQPWEGAMILPASLSDSSASTSAIDDPDILIADLSRRSFP